MSSIREGRGKSSPPSPPDDTKITYKRPGARQTEGIQELRRRGAPSPNQTRKFGMVLMPSAVPPRHLVRELGLGKRTEVCEGRQRKKGRRSRALHMGAEKLEFFCPEHSKKQQGFWL